MSEMKIACIRFDLDSVPCVPADFIENALQMSVNTITQVSIKAKQEKALSELKKIRSGAWSEHSGNSDMLLSTR